MNKEREEGEDIGIIRSLKWVKFLMSYKRSSLVEEEIKKFIRKIEDKNPIYKELERY